ncbi:HYR domain-containing protein, partial [Psychroflexus sediminis]
SLSELTAPTANDNCDGIVTGTTNAVLPITASTTITWKYTDEAGNFSEQTQSVIVDDTTAPIIGEFENKIIQGDEDGNSILADYTSQVEVYDNCDPNPIVSQIPAPGELISGSTEITITVKDNAGNTNSTGFMVVVEDSGDPDGCNTNLFPVINEITGPIDPVPIGNPITIKASISDDNISYATWSLSTDGTTFIDQPKETILGDFISKTFDLPVNVYSIKLLIEDACGVTATSVFEYVVIYDLDGGFVTGGGWIHSPVGAYVADTSLEGKASFGFVAKYKSGRNNTSEVEGNTNFQFRNADFHFKSSAHDDMSLVISGGRSTYKGVGSINGSGIYKFMVVAIDGDLNGQLNSDKFRIKIWESDSDVLVYDNKIGESDNSDATTELEGGSIVIHKPKGNKTNDDLEIKLTDTNEAIEILETLMVLPNPIQTEAVARFSVRGDAEIILKIFDYIGREIQVLYSGSVKAMEIHDIPFQRHNMMSGVYILKLTTAKGHSYERQFIVE